MPTISLCIIVKNWSKFIWMNLRQVCWDVDEIVITDTGSTDNTLEIVKNYTQNINHFEWTWSFSEARNYCQSKATKDYIFWMDADEIIQKKDLIRLKRLIEKFSHIDAFFIPVNDYSNWENKLKRDDLKIYRRSLNWKYMWLIHEQLDRPSTHSYIKTPITIFHNYTQWYKYWNNGNYENTFNAYKELFAKDPYNSNIQLQFLRDLVVRNQMHKFKLFSQNLKYIYWYFFPTAERLIYLLLNKWFKQHAKLIIQKLELSKRIEQEKCRRRE